ncbi:hypothetical protein LX32DRAFT_51664 [Colletotrichum zoysiae]|uniref:Uncharacterized protein n=1 Tax=Colletotrichum zoysiae TaxID=1216348 RepID=A0AAD9M167_9PEZI|nr:hypothetical protein LX32DRAFT_51664 [Colletotrichum zoysiae]
MSLSLCSYNLEFHAFTVLLHGVSGLCSLTFVHRKQRKECRMVFRLLPNYNTFFSTIPSYVALTSRSSHLLPLIFPLTWVLTLPRLSSHPRR